MPTPGEKKALLFFSLVAVLGSATRLVSANQVPAPSPKDVAALDAQIRVVDSVSREAKGKGRSARRARARRVRDSTPPPPTPPVPAPGPAPLAALPLPLDVDLATPAQLESLPGIGPALARRIVAARDSGGSFGSLQDLQLRVRGIGPALARRLAPTVTFSGPRRPSSAERTEPFGHGGTTARPRRRRSH